MRSGPTAPRIGQTKAGFDFRVEFTQADLIEKWRSGMVVNVARAKRSAFSHAAEGTTSAAATAVAAHVGVPKWMIRGVGALRGSKSSGSRIGRSGYVEQVEGVYIYFRQTHINPTGTAARHNAVNVLKRRKGMESGGVSVPAVRKRYPKGFHIPGVWGGVIYVRDADKTPRKQVIELGESAIGVLEATVKREFGPRFNKRFKHMIEKGHSHIKDRRSYRRR